MPPLAGQPPPVKPPDDVNALLKLTAGEAEAATVQCTFWFLEADFVRTYSGKNMPFFQDIREKYPDKLVQVTLTYLKVITGELVKESLSVSQ